MLLVRLTRRDERISHLQLVLALITEAVDGFAVSNVDYIDYYMGR